VTQHVGGVLDIFDRDRLEQLRDRLVAALERLADRSIVLVGGGDRLWR